MTYWSLHIPGGVVLSQSGRVVTLWGGYICNTVSQIRLLHWVFPSERNPSQRRCAQVEKWSVGLGVELRRVTLRYAQDLGVPEEWLVRFGKLANIGRCCSGPRRASEHPAREVLEDGDVVLSINGVTPNL